MILPRAERCKKCGWAPGDSFESEPAPVKTIQPKMVSEDVSGLPFFPYEPREIQARIVNDITSALKKGKHIVIESGTGTGKTIVSLSSALSNSYGKGKKVLYLTRTITQSDQVMKELRAISSIRPVYGITVTGRGRSCPYLRTLADYENIHPSVLSNLCEEGKKKANNGQGGCKFYSMMKLRIDDIEGYCRACIPTSSDFDGYCEKSEVCPYEARKILMKDADVVVAPYVQVLSEEIRDNFLGNMESDGSNLILIVDEAHNLIDAARQQESYSIPMKLVENAKDEVSALRSDPTLCEDVTLGAFIGEIKTIIRSLANEKLPLGTNEAVIPPSELYDRLAKRFGLGSDGIGASVNRMIEIGDERTEMLVERGDNRVSEIYNLGTCLKNWLFSNDGSFLKSVKTGNDGESLHASCIDPTEVTGFIRMIEGAVHMSGTLQPLEQYVRVMGLPESTETKVYPSPFPAENKSVIFVNDVTTKYDEMRKDLSMKTRIRRTITKLCNTVDKNTLVFFPSYHLMNEMRPFLENYIEKRTYWEEQKNPRRTADSLLMFRKGRDGVFFTVMGGSIAEGIDFPGEELCFAIIVGIPYPPPTLETKEMSDLFDRRYGPGTGWRYTSEVPALRKMQQAIGRLIRTDTDRGMAVVLDSRMVKYAKKMDARLSDDPVADASRFFLNEG